MLALTACRCTLTNWLTLRRLRIMQLFPPSLIKLTVPCWCPGAPVMVMVEAWLARLCLASRVTPVVPLMKLLTVREWTMLKPVTLAAPTVCPSSVKALAVVVATAMRKLVLSRFLTFREVPVLLFWNLVGPRVLSRMRLASAALMLKSAR